MADPRVFDGSQLNSVTNPEVGPPAPVPPTPDGNGDIFVSIASYRGEKAAVPLLFVVCSHAHVSFFFW